MNRTPLEKLDREIAMYVELIDALRDRAADTIDHEAHLQLLYVQRAAMTNWPASQDDLDDVAALLEAEPPPVVPIGVGGYGPRPELDILGQTIAIRQNRSRLRRWGRALRAAWRAPRPPDDTRRVYGHGGLDSFL